MLLANLMPLNVSATQSSLRISGWRPRTDPANVSLVHEVLAPEKPSKSEPTVLLRLRSVPHELRLAT